jgi:hypothetical protein
VGPVDVANDLHTLGALAPLLDALRASSATVRALAAHVAGAAAANNPHVQAQVVALGGVELLLGARAACLGIACKRTHTARLTLHRVCAAQGVLSSTSLKCAPRRCTRSPRWRARPG